MVKQANKMEFEKALARLEEIVLALENGDKSLNESLLLFEEGVKLARECSNQLMDAKGRLEVLASNSDASGRKPLEF